MTVLAFERYPVDPAKEKDFVVLVAELLAKMRTAGGALWADAAKATDDEPSYLILSEWRTQADADAWAATAQALSFRDQADGHLRGEVTIRRFLSDEQR